METHGEAIYSAKVERKGGAERDQQGIEHLLGEMEAAFNAHDAARIASFFLPEGSLIDPTGSYAEGREPVLRVVQDNLEHIFGPNAKSRFKLLAVRFLAPDIAFVDASHDVEGANVGGGHMHIHVDAVVKKLVRKDGSRWMLLDVRPRPFAS